MLLLGKYKLFRKHYIANIAVENKTASGLEVVNRDPRKWRDPPDAYSAKIEDIGTRCELVKPGDVATVERWRYLQYDIDDERICANEDHVLLVNGKPVQGVVAMKIIDDAIPRADSQLLLPDANVAKWRRQMPYYHGRVIASSLDRPAVGNELWIKKSERDQWKFGEDVMIFRWDNPDKDIYSNIMAIQEC